MQLFLEDTHKNDLDLYNRAIEFDSVDLILIFPLEYLSKTHELIIRFIRCLTYICIEVYYSSVLWIVVIGMFLFNRYDDQILVEIDLLTKIFM